MKIKIISFLTVLSILVGAFSYSVAAYEDTMDSSNDFAAEAAGQEIEEPAIPDLEEIRNVSMGAPLSATAEWSIRYWYADRINTSIANIPNVNYIMKSQMPNNVCTWKTEVLISKTAKHYQNCISAIDNAIAQWDGKLGISFEQVDEDDDAVITFVVCDDKTLLQSEYGQYYKQSKTDGSAGVALTQVLGSGEYYSHNMDYDGRTKTALACTEARIFLFTDTATESTTRAYATHELGHALGWIGHYHITTTLMYYANSTVDKVDFSAKTHLKQIYDQTLTFYNE